MSPRISAEEEAASRRILITARVVLVLLIIVGIAVTSMVPPLRGFLKYVVIFGIGTLITSGSIAEQVRYRAWKRKMNAR